MSDEVQIVLLAAGRATRMRGIDKMLEEVDGRPLLRVMAARCAKAGATRVVLGPAQEARRATLADLPVDIVEAPEGAGMGASIAAGVAQGTGPVLLVLADMPGVTAADLHLLTALARQAPGAILRAASVDGQPGHPVLFPADLRPALGRLTGDIGAREILAADAQRLHLVPLADDRALIDLDTPEDWAAWRAGRAP